MLSKHSLHIQGIFLLKPASILTCIISYIIPKIRVLFKIAERVSSSQVNSFLIQFFTHKLFMSTYLATKTWTISIGWVMVDCLLFSNFFFYKQRILVLRWRLLRPGIFFLFSHNWVFLKRELDQQSYILGSFIDIVVNEFKRMCVNRLTHQ